MQRMEGSIVERKIAASFFDDIASKALTVVE